ncbi:phospho-2-dehydro-3-deoxyheptonate aldolase [Anaeromyxobacter dehalogenans 2CP-1]|uniref:Phospho-2-dehydro-3-deoxyheptonate aldolase n=1 Tax=Anaeromyxobacter dehalogenans (strain ATCC BAA-258 / DSM 21875 / 2CP-1) TaxID=455488 RepID=B8JAM1_ANAD2|nr:3-deoxy-7-phosphoheptulonate synthase [Anaeromyxobacter dehalogenans]ACL67520.1 phospho-2-dehydro-3-deoxyheptonate aldolase [Anaeromyxobacter dehalogenans 2CP-1]
MLVVMQPHAGQPEIDAVIEKIRSLGLTAHPIPGAQRVAIGITGNKGGLEPELFTTLPGVADAIRVSQPFKLVSREVKEEDTVIDVGGVPLGGTALAVMAGPCSVESRGQLLEAAHAVKAAGARFLRGGAFKPRTSPYEFQGLGEEGLKLLAAAREETGLKVVTEVMDVEHLDMVADYADVLQIGARNMQNYSLLRQLGRVRRPILLKRGPSATIKEWLMAAEYVVSEGNYQVALCERGIRTFETMTRNTLDLNAVPILKALTHLPVIVDPSHGIGLRAHVPAMARAGIAAGADGIIVEVHPRPEKALSDGQQSLTPAEFDELMRQVRVIAGAVGRGV